MELAYLKPFEFRDEETGEAISLSASPGYYRLTVDRRTFYFIRETGEFVGEDFMRGEKVIVRCFGKEARIVLAWDANSIAVLVASPEVYKRLERRQETAGPVAVSISDVFQFNPALEEAILKSAGYPWNAWENLIPWSPSNLTHD